MKIRTITTGISLQSLNQLDSLKPIAEFNQQAKHFFEQQGYEVQTTRMATNPWGEYLQGLKIEEIIEFIGKLEQLCQALNINFFSIGYGKNCEEIELIPSIIENSSIIYCSSYLGDIKQGINFNNLKASAKAIKQLENITDNGMGNFRFCAGVNCPPGIPFFPASYHEGKASFAIGLEYPDLVMKAFKKSGDLSEAENNLKAILESELTQIETIAKVISENFKINYRGIDASLAPSLNNDNSIVYAYESLGLGKFGEPGTLAISAMITRVIKGLSLKLCGYSGLMLPIGEDVGLAERAKEESYNLTNLLLYSAVCGCGLDTIPLAGNITVEQLELILLDVATLAIKLDKPLSARLLPIPGKQTGEIAHFNSPYLVDCKVL